MTYKMIRLLFCLSLLFLFLQCAAFPDPVTSKNRNLKLNSEKRVNLIFTGFYRYEKEREEILENIKKQGFFYDQTSPITLEVILQKKDITYRYPLIHKLHFLLTFLSGGIIPSHIRTEHTLTFRYSKSEIILMENEYSIGMDQWRGIPVILLMITHWPNRIYREQLVETTRLEFIE
jgi:hypothetical protein